LAWRKPAHLGGAFARLAAHCGGTRQRDDQVHLRTSYPGAVACARMLAIMAMGGGTLALTAPGNAAQAPLYTLAATQSCLTRLPNSIVGLPPARPPVPPALFVYALARDDVSTSGVGHRPLHTSSSAPGTEMGATRASSSASSRASQTLAHP